MTTLAGFGVPAAAVAGNLAWQADALAASTNLHPSDGGLMATAALLWKGDHV